MNANHISPDPRGPECPHRPGTEDYHLWWECRHKIAIQRQGHRAAQEIKDSARLRAIFHGHDLDNKERKCSWCGMTDRMYYTTEYQTGHYPICQRIMEPA